jgi:hypothetical protein
MNAKQMSDLLTTHAAGVAQAGFEDPVECVRAISRAVPQARWQAAVCGEDETRIRILLTTPTAPAIVAGPLSLDPSRLAQSPARTRPWLDALWDGKERKWLRVEAATRSKGGDLLQVLVPAPQAARPLMQTPLRTAGFDESIAAALHVFDALEPLSGVQRAGTDWSLILRRPISWPHFLRTDLSAAFSPRAAHWALVLRDARVCALDFDGALWARCVS